MAYTELKGGPTSGHYGHAGREGIRGGSLPGMRSEKHSAQLRGTFPKEGSEAYRVICRTMGVKSITEDELLTKLESMYDYRDRKQDLQARLSAVEVWSNGDIWVKGYVETVTGEAQVGEFSRTLISFEDGTRIVSHDSFGVRKPYQKKGFGSSFYQFTENNYIKAGFDEIVVFAGDDVGGYAWARLGFDFANDFGTGKEIEAVRGSFRYNWEKRYKEPVPEFTHAWEMAAAVGPDGFEIGRLVMTGAQWPGIKSLRKGSIGLAIGDAYYYAKRKALLNES